MNQTINQISMPLIMYEASPYLSPLNGSLSVMDQNSPDELLDFQLEEGEDAEMIGGNHSPLEPEINFEVFIIEKDPVLEDHYFKEESIAEKSEIQTPSSLTKNNSKVYSIVEFLVENDKMNESSLLKFGLSFFENSSDLEFVFKTLMNKFKKLKKTKEEMVKYCMRKAFKYVSDLKKVNKSGKSRKQKSLAGEKEISFEIPFRKNSSEKTMNAQFLKQVFSSKEFMDGYSEFLGEISEIIEDDNRSKIAYLSESIEKIICNGEIKDVDLIKRLPWTRSILARTEDLSRSLIEFGSLSQDLAELNFETNEI